MKQSWLNAILWGNSNSVYPVGCLTVPVLVLYGPYLYVKNLFSKGGK